MAEAYKKSLPKTSAALIFCKIPVALAQATLTCIAFGKDKLTRNEVVKIIDDVDKETAEEVNQE